LVTVFTFIWRSQTSGAMKIIPGNNFGGVKHGTRYYKRDY
jgi:hypothetical protein